MASRLNTILVVLSVPTLLSAAITILWSRKRQSAAAAATKTTDTTTATSATTEKTATGTRAISPQPQSHQEEQSDSSSSAPAPATDQPAPDPAVVDPDSQSEGQERETGAQTCDNTVMQVTDGVDLIHKPIAVSDDQSAGSETKVSVMSDKRQPDTGADVTSDLRTKVEKDLVLKSKGKKNGSGKKGKSLTGGQSPASRSAAQSPAVVADDVPDTRSRKNHDSGDSLDSGADVLSPASSGGAAETKSGDRSIDSPGLFKSDVSQGSPCNWGACDSHSEGSSDSGKGSESLSTSYSPLQQFMPNLTQRMTANVVYQFEIAADLVGKLIGRSGVTIKHISQQSRARIVVNDHPFENCDNVKICTVDGDRLAIADALKMIRACFPLSLFPTLTLSQINAVPIATTQLYLMEAYPNDVMMSSLVSAGQFFLQQPTHPSHDSLTVLNHMMAVTYGEHDAPAISSPSVGIIVAATVPALPGWYRALIVGVSEDEAFCDVKYVDYGGCSRLETSSLRQIRMDFMNLPFQACECYLADVLPVEGDTWSAAATECFEKLAHGCVMKAIVAGMTEDGCTLVRLYKTQGMANICINEELVNRGHARWIHPPAQTSASE